MSRMIINYDDAISDESALKYVESVVAMGRVSGCGEIYCYVSRFADGTVVFSDVTKSGTDTFRVLGKEKQNERNLQRKNID